MLRLIRRDLLDNLWIWVGALLTAAATAVVGVVVAAQAETAIRVRGTTGLALASISGTVWMFGLTAAFVVLSSVTALTVSLQRRSYALWQLLGIGPGYVRMVVTAQLLIVAALGAVLGCLVAPPFLPWLFDFVFTSSTGLEGVQPRFGILAAASVVLFVCLIVAGAGWRPARKASLTPPIELLRQSETGATGMSVTRWIAGAGSIAIVVAMLAGLPGTTPDNLTTPLMAMSPLIAGALAAFGPLYLGRLVRAWTSLVPSEKAWFLARHSTADHVSVSTAAVSPLMVAVALAGGLYAASGTTSAAREAGAEHLTTGTVVLLAGGPLMLSILGATLTVLMSGRHRERELALLRAAGATPTVAIGAALAEAVIYVVTATGLGVVAVMFTAIAGGLAAGVFPAFGFAATGSVALAGLLLMAAATVLPTVAAVRRPVPAVLAAE